MGNISDIVITSFMDEKSTFYNYDIAKMMIELQPIIIVEAFQHRDIATFKSLCDAGYCSARAHSDVKGNSIFTILK